MNIIIDAMGGDNAPKEILLGAAAAVREYGHYRGRRLRDH